MHETFLKVSIIPRLSQVDLKKHTVKYEFFFIIGVQKQYFVCVLKKKTVLINFEQFTRKTLITASFDKAPS